MFLNEISQLPLQLLQDFRHVSLTISDSLQPYTLFQGSLQLFRSPIGSKSEQVVPGRILHVGGKGWSSHTSALKNNVLILDRIIDNRQYYE